jgi:hypothetical protein
MARRNARKPSGDWLFQSAAVDAESGSDSTLLDVVDSVLNKGAVVNGELVLGLANVDLIYAKLSVLLSALDRITNPKHDAPRARQRPAKRAPRSMRKKSRFRKK